VAGSQWFRVQCGAVSKGDVIFRLDSSLKQEAALETAKRKIAEVDCGGGRRAEARHHTKAESPDPGSLRAHIQQAKGTNWM